MPSHYRTRSNPGIGSPPPPYPGTFLLAFGEAIAKAKWKIRRRQGSIVECLDERGREQIVGLENLFRRLRREVRERWPMLMVDFLKAISAAKDEDAVPLDLAAAADQLLVRIGPPFHKDAGDAKIWSEAIGDTGLSINLVLDYPSRMSYVTEQLLLESGKPAQVWLTKAIENLHARTPADCLKLVDAESGIRMCTVGDAFDSSRVLVLDRLLPDGRENGFFVAVPSRDQLLVLPVTRLSLANVYLLKQVAEKTYPTAPYPISNDVFWLRNGKWHRFGIQIRGEQATISPPPEFAEVLSRLRTDIESGSEDVGPAD
jgi:hypothetical protein